MPIACVTGAASGIGAASRALLRERGYDVLGIDTTSMEGLICADVADPSAWRRVVAEIERGQAPLKLVHLNAGVPSRQPHISELTDDQYQRTIGVNLGGVVYGVRALLPHMARDSDIVVTASIAGMRPAPLDPIYTASKHAVIGLVRAIADDLAERGVRINAVCPSYVDTPMAQGNAALVARLHEQNAAWLQPRDVAEAVLTIASMDVHGRAFVCVPGALYEYEFAPIEEPRQVSA